MCNVEQNECGRNKCCIGCDDYEEYGCRGNVCPMMDEFEYAVECPFYSDEDDGK